MKTRSTYPGIGDETPPKRPRSISDLASVTITSGRLVDPDQLGLGNIHDEAFLIELAAELDSALRRAFVLAKRMGFEQGDWRLELPNRVYYVLLADEDGEDDPDQFHRGIAPVVKLLYAVVERLGRVNISASSAIVTSWRASTLPIHSRMWNAIARNPAYASPAEVEAILAAVSDEDFWGMGKRPEITELRAVRFSSLSHGAQISIQRRVRKGPPGKFLRRRDAARVKSFQLHWAGRELRRIQIGGGTLSASNEAWLTEQLANSDELREMAAVDDDFRRDFRAGQVYANPDRRFADMAGQERLDALEAALATTERTWGDDPQSRAWDWLREGENSSLVLQDLEQAPESGAGYPEIWDRFGWAHNPPAEGEVAQGVENRGRRDVERVMRLLWTLPLATAARAIGGISAWLDNWKRSARLTDILIPVWQRLWPVAVDVTNAHQSGDTDRNTHAEQFDDGDQDPEHFDTLNNPVGRMYRVFSALCPNVAAGARPFDADSGLREMRDAVLASTARAGLIARCRMLEAIEWFRAADPEWTTANLLQPLQADSRANSVLWRAMARRHLFQHVLEVIGPEVINRAIDTRLSRDVRSSLARSVVLEALHALFERREPVISFAAVSQMIRSLDDEVRAQVAGVLQEFAAGMSRTQNRQDSPPVEEVYVRCISPFLEHVWPLEAMLTTPGVAKAFADLPITCGEAFVEAVGAIEHFLVPFECWSLHDYGIVGRAGASNLALINSPEKAEALLRLLDRTVSMNDGAPVPYDLGDALERIRKIALGLAERPSYRRLATLTRR